MGFLIGFLTFILVINSLALILLVLVQLPKKDAGAGIAFGGGAADALFGAGSGNALTKITKYAAIIFFALAILVGTLQDKTHHNNSTAFEKQVQQQQQAPMTAPQQAPATVPAAQPAAPGNGLLTMPLSTNASAPAK
jgi:preprotein translocase subunit SecG